MSNYVTLLGAEDVSRAGSAMREAAQEMQSAAHSIDYSNSQQRQYLDDWLVRFEGAIARLTALSQTKEGENG